MSDNIYMNKILLVYEDYADLMAVEGALKRVGFDVIGLTNEYSVTEQILAFNPDLVVGAGRGGKVSSLGVGKRLKEMNRWQGKSVLVFPANFKPNPQDLIRIRVDMVLESPVSPVRLVQVVGKILGHDEATLLERLNKSIHFESPQKVGSGTAGGSSTSSSEGEAIFVKGTVGGAEERSVESERLNENSQEFSLSHGDQERKFSFSIDDHPSEENLEKAEAETIEPSNAFPDVDLKALERELMGGGIPEVERVEVTSSEEDIQAKARASLEKSQNSVEARVAKYKKMSADVRLAPKSTITRVEARRRQRALVADWDSQSTTELDELRRQFTKALFKK